MRNQLILIRSMKHEEYLDTTMGDETQNGEKNVFMTEV